jgi:hypothetical protein
MKRLTATLLSLSVCAPSFAQTNQAVPASNPEAGTITRAG